MAGEIGAARPLIAFEDHSARLVMGPPLTAPYQGLKAQRAQLGEVAACGLDQQRTALPVSDPRGLAERLGQLPDGLSGPRCWKPNTAIRMA